MSYEEFKKRIDTARQILVGAVPSPAGQIDQITYALIYKFMNDIDDRSTGIPGGKRTFFVDDYEQYNWHALMSSSLGRHERLELYRQAIQTMTKNTHLPPLFRSIYQNAFLPFNSPNVLDMFLKEMDKFSHADSDDIGDAYEYLLSITGSQGDVGQFRTPRHIIKFIVDAVGPTKDDRVLDPAVGTAGFLIAAREYVRSHHDGKDEQGNSNDEVRLSADERKKLDENYRGFDIDPTMVRTAQVNMYLHGFKTPNIINHDSLSSEEFWGDKYDVILANPPFMSPKGGIKPHKKFSIAANRSEVLFVDYIATHLKPSGRAGIVVPEGIIFQSGATYKQLRKNLVEDYLYAVVSLPAGIFQPYSGVKTSILLLDKEFAKKSKEILFVKIENDGYSLGSQRRSTPGDQMPHAIELIKSFRNHEEINSTLAHTVPRQLITNSADYNLSGDRYVTASPKSSQDWELTKIEDVFIEIKNGKNVRQIDEEGKYRVSRIQTIATGYVNLAATKWTNDDVSESDFLKKGDILFSHINSYEHLAKTALFNDDEKIVHGANLLRLRPDKSKILPGYASYVLKSQEFRENAKRFAQKAVNQASINSSSVKNLKIPLPPLEVQYEIVAELDSYQKIIDAARVISSIDEFDLDIKASWPTALVQDIFTKVSDSWSPDDGGFNIFVGLEDVSKGSGELLNRRTDEIPISNKTRFKKGDILYGKLRPNLNKVWTAIEDGVCSTDFLVLRPKDSDSTWVSFYNPYFRSKKFNKSVVNAVSGASLPRIQPSHFMSISVPNPNVTELIEMVQELTELQNTMLANKKLIDIYTKKTKAKIDEVWGQ